MKVKIRKDTDDRRRWRLWAVDSLGLPVALLGTRATFGEAIDWASSLCGPPRGPSWLVWSRR